ncbi:MAG: ABC transporter permease [Clostridia bacterium]|nr:ABC transporter permease [Clostridia bacterium]
MEKINIMDIPKNKFVFAQLDDRLHDKKFDTKPIGYFKDAWLRFKKNKSSVVAACIIILIVLFALIAPLVSQYDVTYIDTTYNKMPARNEFLSNFGIATGCKDKQMNNNLLLRNIAIGVASVFDWDKYYTAVDNGFDSNGDGTIDVVAGAAAGDAYIDSITQTDGLNSPYSPISLDSIGKSWTSGAQQYYYRDVEIDLYNELGFRYYEFTKAQLDELLIWQEKSGIQVIYPMIDTTKNISSFNFNNPNYWFKHGNVGYYPIINGTPLTNSFLSEEYDINDDYFEDNYLRNSEGIVQYFEKKSGDNYRVCLLYYNYYIYKNNHEPSFILGTDAQGYDMCVRLASGIQLSLLLSVSIFFINFLIGAIYGAIEGYYGGWADMIMERITDILAGVPFIVVATLFQLHLAHKVGVVPSLLFSFVMTGWIGTAYRVRTQFYRFKNQEYVLAARTLGARDIRLMFKHIFPNTLGTIITSSVLAIPGTIFSESMLSYLGIINLGSSEGTSIGTLLASGRSYLGTIPHLIFWPSLVISMLMISFNLFGNGLRDAFNPSLRGVEE